MGTAAPRPVTTAVASSDADFEQIIALQRRYLRESLSVREQYQEGFVYLQHNLGLLRRMSEHLPQAIALAHGRVVGYCLALAVELRADVPRLEPLFVQIERCSHLGRALTGYRYFVGGQVCVDRDYRGHGLAGRLYQEVRRSLPEPHELCVTEIAACNRVSIRSHEKIGFRTIHEYSDGTDDWCVVAWDLAQAGS